MVEVTSFLRKKSLAVFNMQILAYKKMIRNDWVVIRKSGVHYLVHHGKIQYYYIASGNRW